MSVLNILINMYEGFKIQQEKNNREESKLGLEDRKQDPLKYYDKMQFMDPIIVSTVCPSI